MWRLLELRPKDFEIKFKTTITREVENKTEIKKRHWLTRKETKEIERVEMKIETETENIEETHTLEQPLTVTAVSKVPRLGAGADDWYVDRSCIDHIQPLRRTA